MIKDFKMKNITNYNSFWKKIMKLAIDTAFEHDFVLRCSKVDPISFIQSAVIARLQHKLPSLKDYALAYEELTSLNISPQAYDKRINLKTIDYLKSFVNQLISYAIEKDSNIPELLKPFSKVYIMDSTSEDLPENLKDDFKGSSGCASKAGFKIQYLYEYIGKACTHFDILPQATPDQNYGLKAIDNFSEGSLSLFDLGYTTSDFLSALMEKNAYFVCRFADYIFKVYLPSDASVEIDLQEVLRKNSDSNIEMEVLIGPKRIPVRLVAFKLTKEVADKRKAKAIKNAQKKGKSVSPEHLEFMEWSIIITNTNADQIKSMDLYTIYSLRWYIELVFKSLKSELNLDKLNGQRKERILFEILTVLIIRFMHERTLNLFGISIKGDIEFSNVRSVRIFKGFLSNYILHSGNSVSKKSCSASFLSNLLAYGRISKSKKKKSILDNLGLHVKGGLKMKKLSNEDLIPYGIQSQKKNRVKRINSIDQDS